MPRSSYLILALLFGAVAVAVFFVVKTPDEPAPSVNAGDITLDDELSPKCGAPLADERDEIEQPEPGNPTPLPDGSSGNELVVTGSVTATTGMLPATLSVTATPETGEPQTLQSDDGSFRFEFKEPGNVSLSAEADSWYQLEPVTVAMASAAEIQLAPAALLNGRVDGDTGSGLEGAKIALSAGGRHVGETITDASGYFSFRSLRPAAYRAEISYGDNHTTESLFVVVGDNNENITINAGTALTMRLLDEYGNAIPLTGSELIVLSVFRGNYPMPSNAVSANSGRAGESTWRGLANARYSATIQVPGFEQAHANFDASGDQQIEEVTLNRGGSVNGTLQANGDLPAGVLQIRATKDKTMRFAQLDDENRFHIESLGLGEYKVEAVDVTSNRVVARTTIELTGGEHSVNLEVDVGATLEVQVLADGKTSDVQTWIQIWNADGRRHWANAVDGKAVMVFLEPGDYTMSVRPFGGGFASYETEVVITDGKNSKQVTLHQPNCLKITFVGKGSNAETAGLANGDLLLGFNSVAATDLQALKDTIGKLTDGDVVTMRILRNGAESNLRIDSWQGPLLGVNAEPAYHE